MCAAVSVCLQELIEFRYFILPHLLFRIELERGRCARADRVPSTADAAPARSTDEPDTDRLHCWWTVCELGMYCALNALTLYLFLYRPFTWPSEPGALQRFMW